MGSHPLRLSPPPRPSEEGGLETGGLRAERNQDFSKRRAFVVSRDPAVEGTRAFLPAGVLSLLGTPIGVAAFLRGEDMGRRPLLWLQREVMKDLLPK